MLRNCDQELRACVVGQLVGRFGVCMRAQVCVFVCVCVCVCVRACKRGRENMLECMQARA
jgi:hypothetical protein